MKRVDTGERGKHLCRKEWRSADKRLFVEYLLSLFEVPQGHEALPFVLSKVFDAHRALAHNRHIVGLRAKVQSQPIGQCLGQSMQ
jgi:hypothetical protein